MNFYGVWIKCGKLWSTRWPSNRFFYFEWDSILVLWPLKGASLGWVNGCNCTHRFWERPNCTHQFSLKTRSKRWIASIDWNSLRLIRHLAPIYWNSWLFRSVLPLAWVDRFSNQCLGKFNSNSFENLNDVTIRSKFYSTRFNLQVDVRAKYD